MNSFTRSSIVFTLLLSIILFSYGQENTKVKPIEILDADNDLGVQTIFEPLSGIVYYDEEPVTIRIHNWGNYPQSNFDVSFSLNGVDTVFETIDTTIASLSFIDYIFEETVDLSIPNDYVIVACTHLPNDENSENDCATKFLLMPTEYCSACTTYEDEWIANVLCGDINNSSGWQNLIADYTDISTVIFPGDSVEITILNGSPYEEDMVYVWVDWNNDFIFNVDNTEEYQLINVGGLGEAFEGMITAPESIEFGTYRMRIRMEYDFTPFPCGGSGSSYGEIEDYTIFVGGYTVLNPPQNLIADVINGNDVFLYWDPPEGYNNWLFWDDQENASGIGLAAGGVFYCASRWEPDDLSSYDGQYLTKIAYFPFDDYANIEIMVWKGWDADTLMTSQYANSSVVGEWNEIELDTPVLIDANEELWFGYQISQTSGSLPAGTDDGPAIIYKGDMFSMDGEDWVSLSFEYGLDYNWNLAGFVANSADGKEIAIPMEKKQISNQLTNNNQSIKLESTTSSLKSQFKKSSKELLSYNIYQDSVLIGNTTEEEFYIYDLFPGNYEYYVTAVYDEGESGPSNLAEIYGCLPTPPNPSATVFNDVNVHLECDSMYYTPDHYNFYRDYTLIGTNVEPEFYDTYLPPGNYEYFITAQFGDDQSMYEDILEIEILPPPLPPILNLIFQGQGFELNWNGWYYGIENAIYNVYYSYNNGPWFLKDIITDTLYFDDFFIAGLHCYKISVENAWPEPVYSNEACDFIMGTEERLVERINIYPNPATKVVHISFDEELNAISIYNLVGQIIYYKGLNNSDCSINISEFEPGLYFLKVETNNGLFSEKLIIE